MDADTLERRKPGRPKADSPLTSVSVRVKSAQYDRLCAVAQKEHASLSAVVRSLISVGLRRPER